MKVQIILLILFSLFFKLSAQESRVLPELLNPKNIAVDKKQIYISDYPFILIYSKDTCRLVKKIGGQGQGPGEFYIDKMFLPRKLLGLVISKRDRSLYIDSMGRLSEYGIEGIFKKVIKKDPFRGGGWFYALNNGLFVGYQLIRSDDKYLYDTINLYDNNLKKLKELFKTFFFNRTGNWEKESSNFFKKIALGINYKTDGDKIFACSRGDNLLRIVIFNNKGEKINEVRKKIKLAKLLSEFESRARRYYQIKYKLGLDFNLKHTFFPEYYPAVHDFAISNKKIYVFTYKRQGMKNQVFIFGENGDLIKEDMVWLKERNPEYFFPFFIYDEKIYQIFENEEKEHWELKIDEIK